MPCLLLRGTALVKTVRFRNPSYIGDPINTVRIFNEKEVDELVVLDITAAAENRPPDFSLIEEIATECFMPFTYGGGIRNLDDLVRIQSLGVEKVIINSYAAENPNFISEAAAQVGSQAVVVSIDARKKVLGGYEVYSHGGTNRAKADPVTFARLMEDRGAGEILLTSIDRDGTMSGYDLELISRVTNAVGVPVIACGGAGSLSDFDQAVNQAGASAVAAGSMVVYQGENRAVLINFPSESELDSVLDRSL
jgi:cyclase